MHVRLARDKPPPFLKPVDIPTQYNIQKWDTNEPNI